MKQENFSQLLLDWYAVHARKLPWRDLKDPYAVWVSEIMLQQTRVETVIPYYEKWMRRFPTVETLAAATEQDVLNAWEGLGYYSRARNMLKAAITVYEKFGGIFPRSVDELKKLPGIGRYTAAAVASIAFDIDLAVLDGNVKRVLARVYQVAEAVDTPSAEKHLWNLAQQLLPPGRASAYNQAVMDLGATICTPKSPDCENCPVQSVCLAWKASEQTKYPLMLQKVPVPEIEVCAAIIERDGLVLIARRPSKGLLGGMWEFPGGKVEPGESHAQALVREIREELNTDIHPLQFFGTYRHAYTHFKVILQAWRVELTGAEPQALEASEIQWVELSDLQHYPMGKIDRSISNDLILKN